MNAFPMMMTSIALLAAAPVTVSAVHASEPAQAAPQTVPFKITLNNVRADNGPIYVSVQKEGEFLQPRGSYGTIVRQHGGGTVTAEVPNVAPGTYAVMVWHDNDGDLQFDMTAAGLPAEGTAMSFTGDMSALRGPPSFAQAQFTVDAAHNQITLSMRYPAGQ